MVFKKHVLHNYRQGAATGGITDKQVHVAGRPGLGPIIWQHLFFLHEINCTLCAKKWLKGFMGRSTLLSSGRVECDLWTFRSPQFQPWVPLRWMAQLATLFLNALGVRENQMEKYMKYYEINLEWCFLNVLPPSPHAKMECFWQVTQIGGLPGWESAMVSAKCCTLSQKGLARLAASGKSKEAARDQFSNK